ncbi:peptidoglycan recognition protein family protein [Streptomyces sp. NPDC002845]
MSEPPATPTPTSSHRRKSRFSRRGVLGGAAAVAAGAALTPTVFAAGDDSDNAPADNTPAADADKGTKPEKFPATRAETVKGTGEATTAFAASYVGVRWKGAQDGVDVLFANGEASPGTWQPLTVGCATVEDGGTALVAAGDATAFEVKASAGATGVRCRAVDTTDGPKRTFRVPTEPTRVRGVRYFSRPAWGADESKRFLENGDVNSPEQYFPLQCITVHHTATPNDDPDPAATVRAIYDFHAITNDWGDIGYHFLIDESGNVYEGRYSDDDGMPAFDKDGNVVTGFHTGGFNSGNLGIALLGTLTEQGPTDAAKASLTRLIRVITRVKGLDPQAKTTFVNPVNGVERDVETISGHRDWMATECPGQTMYDLLAEVRVAAAR